MDGLWVNPFNYILSRWLFLRVLGLIYLAAYASFGLQVRGLIGEQGILPTQTYLAAIRRTLGRRGFIYYPTLAWLNGSDIALLILCWGGALLGLLLLLGLQTTWVLALLWLGYLSLVSVGQVFLGYQWDALLLEAGFLAIFLVPPSLLPVQTAGPPSPFVILLFHWLLFRLMFMSGVVKLASGDETWHNLTALCYHYETQPLPTPMAWYLHQAPAGFQKFSTLFTFLVELVFPFTFFMPRLLRFTGGAFTVFLQVLILVSGNFAFFNYLTLTLVVLLYDDAFFRPVFGGLMGAWIPNVSGGAGPGWSNWILVPLAVFLFIVGLLFLVLPWIKKTHLLLRVQPILALVSAFRLVNSYGLFAVMTTRRPEIVVEGSEDGEVWLPYAFPAKPGDLRRPPPVVAPHQPRLDWQMWFAALRGYNQAPWFLHFAERLLEGSPPVLALLAGNPFPEHPPTYVRARLYDYHFATPEERAAGLWWRREELGLWLPPVSLSE